MILAFIIFLLLSCHSFFCLRFLLCPSLSGTGKTATFAIGILQTLDTQIKECQSLVLAPTRELAQQIVKVDTATCTAVRVHYFTTSFFLFSILSLIPLNFCFEQVITSLGDFMNIAIHACVGGTAVRDDIRTLQEGVHVVVGTPGRVYDMIQR